MEEAVRHCSCLGSQPISNLDGLRTEGERLILGGDGGASGRTNMDTNGKERERRLVNISTGSTETQESLYFLRVVFLSSSWG